ncbi:cyclic dehypoxanthinyl futalosine synthase [Pelosinus sp. IPA-1]|uniref:cyclic dehypoxanthinyl futalosine synthase n=1 Tax=Pelosinus sp. IPA-1 TaxID=3029569 RepID=UPI0024361B24|nr:cyclic dehypoxanthinyl futalosine synthase [Pelosinus sp. IPA-1]GMA97818.1 cyclic dehypoxanthine futalosine synthase [Pelosinus sp. IPA-1]
MNKILTTEKALEMLSTKDVLELGQAANKVRQEMHPDNLVTFVIDRNINYTNICTSECRFCAFFRAEGHPDGYTLSKEIIFEKLKETIEAGGTQVMLQGGLNPALGLEYYIDLLTFIKKNFNIVIHSFSPAEILHIAKKEGISVTETLVRLKAAGLDSLPGGGAEILVDEVRQRVSPKKISASDWLMVMEAAHQVGLETTATMVIGMGETYAQRMEHMEKVRTLQEKTGGFRAFIIWSFQPGNTQMGGEKISAWDYLKTLSIARLYFHNIKHIQGSWVTQGQNIGQLTLAFGANDLGSIMLEENVVKAAGTSHQMTIDKMLNLIRETGKKPAQRDTQYNIIKTFA